MISNDSLHDPVQIPLHAMRPTSCANETTALIAPPMGSTYRPQTPTAQSHTMREPWSCRQSALPEAWMFLTIITLRHLKHIRDPPDNPLRLAAHPSANRK